MQSLVTIGIPTFNRAASLRRTLASAIGQEYSNLQIVVSDNASTDETALICAEFQARDPRVQYVRQPQNVGAVRNFAAVFEHAAGDYFMWLGDDDWIDPTYVASCIKLLAEDPALALAAGAAHYYQDGILVRKAPAFALRSEDSTRRVLEYYRRVMGNGQFYGLIRTSCLRSLQFHNLIGWDWYVLAGLAFQGKMASVDSTCIHRETGGSGRSYQSWVRSTASARILAHSAALAYLGIASYAAADIVHGSRAYRAWPAYRRYRLASQVFWVISRRHVPLRAKRDLKAVARQALGQRPPLVRH